MMKKRLLYITAVAVCLLLGVARWVDLVNFTELSTGFVSAGSAWQRYAAMGAGVLVLLVFSRFMSVKPAALRGRCPALGVCSALAGASMVFFGAITLLEWYFGASAAALGPATKAAELLARYFGGGAWMDALTGLLGLLAGVWLVVRGVAALHPLESQGAAGAAGAVVCALFSIWLLIERFDVRPASSARVGNGMLVLSALAALVFLAVYGKVFCLPGAPIGRSLFFGGMACFLLCTCSELLQTVCSLLSGNADLLADPWGIPLGLLGLCGLCAAGCAAGEDREV